MEQSKIEWTDHTFNPWIGCQKVSKGCDNCYAELLTKKYGWTEWGPHGKRVRTSAANWRKPLQWNKQAQAAGTRARVFCASLADIFDNQAPAGAREDLFDLIRNTPYLDWQLLTKRPENYGRFLPEDWSVENYPNVWLGITAEDQEAYDTRWPVLACVPAAVRFISYEPALGPLLLTPHGPIKLQAALTRRGVEPDFAIQDRMPDWLIWGGESGNGARVMNPEWARSIEKQCRENNIMIFGKQWGTYKSNPLHFEGMRPLHEVRNHDPWTNGKGGALLDGKITREFPS